MKINAIVLFLFGLFTLNSVASFAQKKYVDSLKFELKRHKEKDTIRVNILYDLAYSHLGTDLSISTKYLDEAEEISEELNYVNGKAEVYYARGIVENMKSDYDKSLLYFNKSLLHFTKINDKAGIASIYVAYGITFFDQAQYTEAITAYDKAAEFYGEIGNRREQATCLINTANAYSEMARFDEAKLNYTRSLKISKSINDDDGISFVYNNLAVVYRKQGNYSLAIDHFHKGLSYDVKTQDSLGISNALNGIGEVYSCMANYTKALQYHKKSLNYALKNGMKSLIAANKVNIGNIYKEQKEFRKALQNYKTALDISLQINDLKTVAISYTNLGSINLLLKKTAVARENFFKAKKLSETTDNLEIVTQSLLGIAETYIAEKNFDQALIFAKKGENLAKKINVLESQKIATELLSEIYKNKGQYKIAYEYSLQFKTLSDSLFNKESIEKIAQIEYEYKYKNQLELANFREQTLRKTVKKTNKNLEKSQQNYLFSIIVFLVVTIILLGVIFFLRIRNVKSKTQNIIIEQKLLRSQMTPHFIFNSLSVMQGMILNKEEKKSITYLSKFSKLLRIILENSRFKSVPLSDELAAIENYLALHNLENETYKYSIKVDPNIDQNKLYIPPMLIQPFVENAIEHAFNEQIDEKHIDIHLSFEANELICTILDNGIGILAQKETKKKDKNSLSSVITAERLKFLSGDFKMKGSVSIEDRKKYNEQGTIVTLVIPFKAN